LVVGTITLGYEAEKARLLELAQANTLIIQGEDRVVVKEVIVKQRRADDDAQAVRERITNAKPSVDWSIPADDVGVWNAALCAGYNDSVPGGTPRPPASASAAPSGSGKQGGGAQQPPPECRRG
jgi:hypothetical protein